MGQQGRARPGLVVQSPLESRVADVDGEETHGVIFALRAAVFALGATRRHRRDSGQAGSPRGPGELTWTGKQGAHLLDRQRGTQGARRFANARLDLGDQVQQVLASARATQAQ